jgi:NodT family efflux transporter outer membrane factor (OMF) lipoprotein
MAGFHLVVSKANSTQLPWLGRHSTAGGMLLAAMALLTLVVSGCTPFGQYIDNGLKVGPNYHKPPAPVAEDWIDAADQRVRKESDDLSHWWRVFDDPILNSLICFAYRQNITLKEAGFRVLQARAELGIATGLFFPQVQTANGGFIQTGVSHEVANIVATPQRFFGTWGAGFGLGWEIDFWGRLRRSIESATANLNVSVENYDDVLVTLLSDVAANYVQMRVLERQLDLVHINVELQRKTLALAKARLPIEQNLDLDINQAQSLLFQTEALIPELEIHHRKACNRLCILLGLPPDCLMGKLRCAPIPRAPAVVAMGIPAQLLCRRPDVRRAERAVAAQCALIGVAEADLYPQVTILGTIGYSAEQFASLFNSQAFYGAIGPTFQWKILNYGRIVHNIDLHDARFQEKVAFYQNTVLKASEEAENGLVTFLKAQLKLHLLDDSVAASFKAVHTALKQYEEGTLDFNRVAVLEQNLVQQQDSEMQAQGEIALGLIQVYKALGGGWEIRLTGCTDCPPPLPGPEIVPFLKPSDAPAPKPEALPLPKRASDLTAPLPRGGQTVVPVVPSAKVPPTMVDPAIPHDGQISQRSAKGVDSVQPLVPFPVPPGGQPLPAITDGTAGLPKATVKPVVPTEQLVPIIIQGNNGTRAVVPSWRLQIGDLLPPPDPVSSPMTSPPDATLGTSQATGLPLPPLGEGSPAPRSPVIPPLKWPRPPLGGDSP